MIIIDIIEHNYISEYLHWITPGWNTGRVTQPLLNGCRASRFKNRPVHPYAAVSGFSLLGLWWGKGQVGYENHGLPTFWIMVLCAWKCPQNSECHRWWIITAWHFFYNHPGCWWMLMPMDTYFSGGWPPTSHGFSYRTWSLFCAAEASGCKVMLDWFLVNDIEWLSTINNHTVIDNTWL